MTSSWVHNALITAIASSVRARRLCERYAKGVELDRLIAATNSDVDLPPESTPTSGDLLGDVDPVVQRRGHHRGAEPDPFGAGGDVGCHRHRVGEKAVVGEVVLAKPAGVEADSSPARIEGELLCDGGMVRAADPLAFQQVIARDPLDVAQHERVKRRKLH